MTSSRDPDSPKFESNKTKNNTNMFEGRAVLCLVIPQAPPSSPRKETFINSWKAALISRIRGINFYSPKEAHFCTFLHKQFKNGE